MSLQDFIARKYIKSNFMNRRIAWKELRNNSKCTSYLVASYPVGTGNSFPGCKAGRDEVTQSLQSSAEVKYAWGFTYTSSMSLYGMVFTCTDSLNATFKLRDT
jgi:hypothetical protein